MLKQALKSPARILRFKQPFHSSPFSLFPVPHPKREKKKALELSRAFV